MKNTITLFLLFVALFAAAQAPQGLNYQAIYRNAQGNAIANQNVDVQFSILNGSANGSAVYVENHATQTNEFGLFNLTIGQGTPVAGNFSNINWGNGSKFLKVGVNNALLGTTQLMSVPYALYAEKTNSTWSTDDGNTFNDSGTVVIGSDSLVHEYEGYVLQLTTPGYESGLMLFGDNGGSNYNSITMRDLPTLSGWSIAHKATSNINHQLMFEYLDGVTNVQNYNTFKITSTGKSGFGMGYTDVPPSRVSVKGGDVNILDVGSGVIMKSPNGNCWRMTVTNTGQPVFTSITCPQ
ncbi:MAG: hypothetical protein IPN76_14030 [Saprospiraceae bacterium]|nr:hypothetical protein [Saprospiraceae bacterium]